MSTSLPYNTTPSLSWKPNPTPSPHIPNLTPKTYLTLYSTQIHPPPHVPSINPTLKTHAHEFHSKCIHTSPPLMSMISLTHSPSTLAHINPYPLTIPHLPQPTSQVHPSQTKPPTNHTPSSHKPLCPKYTYTTPHMTCTITPPTQMKPPHRHTPLPLYPWP